MGQIQYRASGMIWMLGGTLEPVIYLVVWSVVARSQGGEVAGFAHDADDGQPLAWAMVVAIPLAIDPEVPDQRRFPAVQSDATGAFRVRHLPPGRYLVQLAAGADRREVEVLVPAQGAVDPGF